ncbi:hypothetical protein BD324DRAFT_305012 [Kockovaella imperatae]|uniref:Uncharacterized protein n=1 Tax=Kockovaella imperatae TaxID=4999 RepID=A0A1Y1UPG3_9TREE|nr:hypothetical protein BD324DRAFT_305012 [Kockovaella imperatae]ORX39025.1 hypothetical protein BD324DRAFT_305012 [Kockovaella imperatae]
MRHGEGVCENTEEVVNASQVGGSETVVSGGICGVQGRGRDSLVYIYMCVFTGGKQWALGVSRVPKRWRFRLSNLPLLLRLWVQTESTPPLNQSSGRVSSFAPSLWVLICDDDVSQANLLLRPGGFQRWRRGIHRQSLEIWCDHGVGQLWRREVEKGGVVPRRLVGRQPKLDQAEHSPRM